MIDPRTLVPLDMETIVDSVERTGRALVVQEAVRTAGAGAEIAARIQEAAFFALDAPVWRLGAIDTPLPQDPELEQLVHPERFAYCGSCPGTHADLSRQSTVDSPLARSFLWTVDCGLWTFVGFSSPAR